MFWTTPFSPQPPAYRPSCIDGEPDGNEVSCLRINLQDLKKADPVTEKKEEKNNGFFGLHSSLIANCNLKILGQHRVFKFSEPKLWQIDCRIPGTNSRHTLSNNFSPHAKQLKLIIDFQSIVFNYQADRLRLVVP